MQQSKSKLATSIVSVLLAYPDWSQAAPATVRVAQVGGDKTDLLAALSMVDFWLDVNTPVQCLMFHPMPLELAPPALSTQSEPAAHVDATQPAAALADPMATVLALLQEQKVAMSEQKAASEAASE